MASTTADPMIQAHDEYMAGSGSRSSATLAKGATYLAEKTTGLVKYLGSEVSSMVKAVGPKKLLATGLGCLAGGPFLGAIVLGIATEGTNSIKGLRDAGIAYVEAQGNAREYGIITDKTNQIRAKYGLPQEALNNEGFYVTMQNARKYEGLVEAAKESKAKDLGEFLASQVIGEKSKELEGTLRAAYLGLESGTSAPKRDEVRKILGAYETFSGSTGLTKYILGELNKVEGAIAKEVEVIKRNRAIIEINKATTSTEIQKLLGSYQLAGESDKLVIDYANTEIKKMNAFNYYEAARDSLDNDNLKTAKNQAITAARLFKQLSFPEEIEAQNLLDEIKDEIEIKFPKNRKKRTTR